MFKAIINKLFPKDEDKLTSESETNNHDVKEADDNRPLYQSFYTGIDNIYAGEYPGDKYGEKAEDKLRQMSAFGVRHYIDLTQEGELNPYAHLLPDDATHTRFPIPDCDVPESVEAVHELVGKIMKLSKQGNGYVYIHCWGGVGRTGTIVACLMAEQMKEPTFDKVMHNLRQHFTTMPKAQHRVTPDTKEQEKFIKKYVESLPLWNRQEPERLRDRVRGSLVGGAVGDALGYPVEFMSLKAIQQKYGVKGIRRYQDFDKNGKAVVSDDTQMTLFTANGLLFGVTRFCTHGILGAGLKDYVQYAYHDWYQTQTGVEDYNAYHYCWIRDIKELNACRAPGNTCMSALQAINMHKTVTNDSKGCGGVMRVAPVGLMAAADEMVLVKDWHGEMVPRLEWKPSDIVRLGGDCAAITHKHPLGYLPAAFMAALIYYILRYEGAMTFDVMDMFLGCVYADVKKEYQEEREQHALEELWHLIEKAVNLAARYMNDAEAIAMLGEGWTGDEALAIAIYCMMKHIDNFEDAVVAAVNHDGDSDSTGSICGNLMGAIVGYDDIPTHFKERLELKSLIIDLSDDIVKGCTINEYHSPSTSEEMQWEKRYVWMDPRFTGVFSFLGRKYAIMPNALRALETKDFIEQVHSTRDSREKCQIAYRLALNIFDTDTFSPMHPLPYHKLCNEPSEYFLMKEITPAYCYGYEDSKYSPRNDCRVFKLNIHCFEGKNPVIAFRADCGYRNELRAGLTKYENKQVTDKYPLWEFYQIDPSTADGGYAVLTNQLENEFAVEIAHLTEDCKLHRIYHLYY